MKNIEDSAGFPDELLARRIEYLSGFMTAGVTRRCVAPWICGRVI